MNIFNIALQVILGAGFGYFCSAYYLLKNKHKELKDRTEKFVLEQLGIIESVQCRKNRMTEVLQRAISSGVSADEYKELERLLMNTVINGDNV